MPQTFQVVSCYSCAVYQVKQQTKANKWSCKMCGEKQSLKKVHFEGAAPDCRKATQKLNMNASSRQRNEVERLASVAFQEQTTPDPHNSLQPYGRKPSSLQSGHNNKWSCFMPDDSSTMTGPSPNQELSPPGQKHGSVQSTSLFRPAIKLYPESRSISSRVGDINTTQCPDDVRRISNKVTESRPLKRLSNTTSSLEEAKRNRASNLTGDAQMPATHSDHGASLWDDFL